MHLDELGKPFGRPKSGGRLASLMEISLVDGVTIDEQKSCVYEYIFKREGL